MTLRFIGLTLAAAILATAATAKAPTSSMLPQLRPVAGETAEPTMRPVPRPTVVPTATPPVGDNPPVEVFLAEGDADPDEEPVVEVARLAVSPYPIPRPRVVIRNPAPDPAPERVVTVAAPKPNAPTPPPARVPTKRPRGLLAAIFNAPNKPTQYPREGSVCGDPAIRGQAVPPIPAKLRGCGLSNPVRVTAVDGVALSVPATIGCGTAVALRSWVSGTVKPAVGKMGGGVAGLKVAASYSCRTRNNIPGGKISEHGRGNAIDISAIILKDGTAMTVLRGWRNKVHGPILKAIHARACGTFGTVLGPNSDRYHQDHFHFDVAKHGYGPYCR